MSEEKNILNQFKVPEANRNSVSEKKLDCNSLDELLSYLADDKYYEDVGEQPYYNADDQYYEDVGEPPYDNADDQNYDNVDDHQHFGKNDQPPYCDVPDQDYCDKNDYSKRAKDLQAAFGRKYVPIDCGWCTFYIDEQRLDEADEIIRAANEAYMRMLSEMMDNGRK